MISILIVEDDPLIGEALKQWLSKDHPVVWAKTHTEARVQLDSSLFDIVVLDIGLPDGSGLDLLRHMKREKQEAGVLILTAYGEVEQRVTGLDLGADDYLAKPVDFKELDARIRAVRRRKDQLHSSILDHENLQLDINGMTLTRDGEVVALSKMEISILAILLQGRGRYFSKPQIEQKLYSLDAPTEGNAIEVHVSALRRKLGKDLIKTTRGLGYIIPRGTGSQ